MQEGVPISAPSGNSTPQKRVLLANPRGFCAGVERAISAVELTLERYGAPVFVRRAIVHNTTVVERLEKRGAIFVQELDAVPEGAVVILSAHGSARRVKVEGRQRRLQVIDAICPLVAKVHAEVEAWYRAGRHVLMIGHQGHPEIVGTMGQLPVGAISVVSTPEDLDVLELGPNCAVAIAIQTTFALREAEAMIAAIRERFSDVATPRANDICYATTNRQTAIDRISREADVVLVVGDTMSSNARRLVEVAKSAGCPEAFLIADVASLPWKQIAGATTVGLTAAASAPESTVQSVCEALMQASFHIEEVDGPNERVRFRPVPLEAEDGPGEKENLEGRISKLRADIDELLESAIGRAKTGERRLADAMQYAVVGGGKRFRAMLVVAVSELVGGSYQHALRVGAAIECIHAQSLIHDDLPCMDDDDLRRGRPTVHRQFDEATAVLAGDALLALAFEILAEDETHPDPSVRARLVLALARAIGQEGLAGGQMMDLFPPANPTQRNLFDCESRKTGALIRFAVEAGALLGECSATELERLVRFAENLGLVFQIRDDMLDRIGDASIVGKALGKDDACGRVNATALLGLDGAAQQASAFELACHEALNSFGDKAGPLRDLARFAVSRLH